MEVDSVGIIATLSMLYMAKIPRVPVENQITKMW